MKVQELKVHMWSSQGSGDGYMQPVLCQFDRVWVTQWTTAWKRVTCAKCLAKKPKRRARK